MNDKNKRECEALKCVLEIGVASCFECSRVVYCEKRRRSIDACLVFRPRRELIPGTTYVLDGSWREGMVTFAKHVFMGKGGLLFTSRSPPMIVREFMLENVKIYRFVGEKAGRDEIYVRNLEALRKTFLGEIDRADIVLLDGLQILIKANNIQKIVPLIEWMSREVSSHFAILLILTDDLTPDQKDKIKDIITDARVKEIIKSVSNPKRMEIINHLRQVGKSTFSGIYRELRYSVPPKLSFHLKVLRDSGVIEQDDEGVYYISDLGSKIAEMIDRIGKTIRGLERPPTVSRSMNADSWNEKYEWYLRRMKRIAPISAKILKDVEDSLQLILGKRKTDETFQIVLKDYVETEKQMTRGDLKRMISEIAFVFLVEVIPLVEAIEWADELLNKHSLK
jgi:DNA-binding transcriptional ArsR family regulator